jgi:RNA polymerase sigma-70 factor (ECF subfamily)
MIADILNFDTIPRLRQNAFQGEVMHQTGDSADATPDTHEFAALLQRIAVERDKAAFRIVFRYFAPRVRAYLIGRQKSPNFADDVVQDVMLSVWRKAHTYDPAKAAVSSWIFRIARNRMIDHHRQSVRRTGYESAAEIEPESPPPQAEDLMVRSEDHDRVAGAMKHLPEKQRMILELSFREGLTHQEISTRTNVPLGTVKSNIRLAMQKLKSRLGET